MKTLLLLIFIINASLFAQNKKQSPSSFLQIETPGQIWGQLFIDVQLSMALGDNKTFVDAIPKFTKDIILAKYTALHLSGNDSAKIRDFVVQNFKLPVAGTFTGLQNDSSLVRHIERLWTSLIRRSDTYEPLSSLLPLPKTYIVPGGRFREIYYWDSYFTMLGLAASNRYDLIQDMLDNFKYLIEQYGHIPNGNRSYYLSRSQPPYFALMVALLHDKMGDKIYKKYLPAMQQEYNWWMSGSGRLAPGVAYRRVVKLLDGAVLNRYYDDINAPRQESYRQDVETGAAYTGKDSMAYTHIRAAAESGWDFSSRWLADTAHLLTIETADIIPVDLNCLLYAYENVLVKAATAAGYIHQAAHYAALATSRRSAIVRYCWSDSLLFFFDYNIKNRHTTNRWSLAGVMPLFVKIATKEQGGNVKERIEQTFLKEGGVVTTPFRTGQQWDAPNGWAPLQYITTTALSAYNYNTLATTIATRWMKVNETVYKQTGKMLEKYNVENIELPGGGGEYPSQDGFGWSNGVYLRLRQIYAK